MFYAANTVLDPKHDSAKIPVFEMVEYKFEEPVNLQVRSGASKRSERFGVIFIEHRLTLFPRLKIAQ